MPTTRRTPPIAALTSAAIAFAIVLSTPAGAARCYALVVTDARGNPAATSGPTGFGPAQLQGAYALPTTGASGQTVAIVDAYDDPTAKADLDVFDAAFGLPAFPNCSGSVTTACFQKVNQNGAA